MAGAGRAIVCAGDSKPTESVHESSFEADIRPIIHAKCLNCHGEKTHKAELDLTTPASLLKGGESGPAIVPGQPEKSLLFEKIKGGEMPPDEKDLLNEAEIKLIEHWIARGAKSDVGKENPPDLQESSRQLEVIPILLRHCTVCHGRHRQEAGLDLRTQASILRGGKSGPAIVPGQPEISLIIQKTRAGEMPPRERLVEVSVKPIDAAEIEVLEKWIATGAHEITIQPDVATSTPDPLVSDEDREFWAFRPPQPVVIPSVRESSLVRNAIDAFILNRLEQKGLLFAPEADRLTLMRRAYFDLTGLPAEPAEIEAFLADRDPQAYEKLIERLLESPRYGERWGRYWLDLAGYADSEGKREQDLPRPHAWRYRDYVIRSLNTDKPYAQFLMEQIAGDEIADYEHALEITSDVYENLVATGFLRMVPDATWANITGYIPDRIDVIADEIDVLGSAVMGLTLKCARCHSHKFDPLPQRDYYRLVAIFKGAYDEFDWLKPDVRPGLGPVSQDILGGRHLPFVTTDERRAWEKHEAHLDEEIRAAKANLEPESRVKALEAQRQPEPRIQALWDRGEPSPTFVYRRGDPNSPGRIVGPGVPSVLTDGKTPFVVDPPWPDHKTSGRRIAFARWLTRPDHPLTARVAVNRIWKHHFGTGIVKTLGNFGKTGATPTHPELLDWLAQEFVRQGGRQKAMHFLMMTSTTYRQSSGVTAELQTLDPANALVSRMPLTRLDAESLYDTLLQVAGCLDETRFGPADEVVVRPDGLVTPAGKPGGWRRLIYVQQSRKQIVTHRENFDFPQMSPNCLERRDSLVAPQALHLMNNRMVFELAERFASRVQGVVGVDNARQVDLVYLIALSRLPSDEEKGIGVNALKELAGDWVKHQSPADSLDADLVGLKSLTAFCHAIMNSANFLYLD